MLISDVLDLVDVDHHHGMVLGGRTADLNEQIGQGGIRLGAVLGAHGQGSAGDSRGLNAAQQVADALLPGCWQTRRVGEGQQSRGDSLDGVASRRDAQLRRDPVAILQGLARDPAHQRGFSGAGFPQDCAAALVDAGGSARAKSIPPVAEVLDAPRPHQGHRVRAWAER